MDRHMEQELNVAVAEYVRTGVSRIPWWKMYAAHNAHRLGVNAWRDLKDRIIDQGGSWQKARVVETQDGFLLIEDGKGNLLSARV